MFGINCNFLNNNRIFNQTGLISTGKKSRRKHHRRRFGAVEQLERREMMAADTGELEANSLALRDSSGPQTAAVVAAANLDVETATARAKNDNTMANAQQLGLVHGVVKRNDRIGPNDRKDFYSFVIDDLAKVTLRLNQLSADLKLVLYEDNVAIATAFVRDGTSTKIVKDLGEGTYYIGVFQSDKDTQSDYRLTVDVDIAGEKVEKATTIVSGGSWSYTDWVGSTDKSDFLGFNLSTDRFVTFRLDPLKGGFNPMGGLHLSLRNWAGREIASTSNEVLQLDLAKGKYFAVITSFGESEYRFAYDAAPLHPSAGELFNISLLTSGLTLKQQDALNAAVAFWEVTIQSELDPMTYRGQLIDDLLIEVSAATLPGKHGEGKPVAVRSLSGLPCYGTIVLNTADLAPMEESGELLSLAKHEIAHVLGFGTLWSEAKPKTLIQGAGTSNPVFTGEKAIAEYKKFLGLKPTAIVKGVPVENVGGKGRQDMHWRESVFGSELMTGLPGPGTDWPISTITIASMADLGYKVSYFFAREYTSNNANRALAGVTAPTETNTALPGPKTATSTRASLATGLSTLADLKSPARRLATAINPTPPASFMPNATKLNAARTAAIESFSRVSDFDDLAHDESSKSLRSAFDLAWSDFSAQLHSVRSE